MVLRNTVATATRPVFDMLGCTAVGVGISSAVSLANEPIAVRTANIMIIRIIVLLCICKIMVHIMQNAWILFIYFTEGIILNLYAATMIWIFVVCLIALIHPNTTALSIQKYNGMVIAVFGQIADIRAGIK